MDLGLGLGLPLGLDLGLELGLQSVCFGTPPRGMLTCDEVAALTLDWLCGDLDEDGFDWILIRASCGCEAVSSGANDAL